MTIQAEEEFRDFLQKNNHEYHGRFIVDSPKKFERISCSNGKSNNDNLSYWLHTDPKTGCLYGFVQCWDATCVFKQNWHENNITKEYTKLSPEELEARSREILNEQKKCIESSFAKNEKSAQKAHDEWNKASENSLENLPYVIAKKFVPYGAKKLGNTLLVPLRDVNGKLWNVEHIYAKSHKKRPVTGARVDGLFHLIGDITHNDLHTIDSIQLAEGFCSSCIVFESTKKTTLCCRNASNLIKVARALKQINPKIKIHIIADDDKYKLEQRKQKAIKEGKKVPEKNVGLDAAIQIGILFNASISCPDYSVIGSDEEFLQSEKPPSDFHDIFFQLCQRGWTREESLNEVLKQINKNIKQFETISFIEIKENILGLDINALISLKNGAIVSLAEALQDHCGEYCVCPISGEKAVINFDNIYSFKEKKVIIPILKKFHDQSIINEVKTYASLRNRLMSISTLKGPPISTLKGPPKIAKSHSKLTYIFN